MGDTASIIKPGKFYNMLISIKNKMYNSTMEDPF